MKPLLRTQRLCKSFGGLRAVQNVDLEVFPGQIFSLIGPNGAGKTTFFNCLSGIYRPDGGGAFLEERAITGLPPHQVCRLGIARTFQNIRLFPEMTALENVMAGQFRRRSLNPWRFCLRTRAYRNEENAFRDEALKLLDFVGLTDTAALWARNLSYGLQRRLEIARALATHPRVLLLDEPGAGMNPNEISDLLGLIKRIRDRGLAVVLIEHHMKVVMEISDQILVLDHGEKIAVGTPERVRQDPAVIAAYLGKEAVSET